MSSRELSLAWITMVVVLLAATYWFGQPRVQEWKDAIKARETLNGRRREAERMLEQQDGVNASMAALRQQLPQYAAGKDVSAELLMLIERTANENALVLLRRQPEKEKSVGDLYEVAIDYTWEAELDALVRFLYALQVQGAILDVRQLTVTPAQGPGRLKGSFTVDYAYTRTGTGLGSVTTQPAAAR